MIKEGFFKDGKLDGYGRVCYSDTYQYYIGNFKNDLFNGQGKLLCLDGKVLQGLFKDN